MPRPKPKFKDHLHYFNGASVVEPLPETYNNNTLVLINCPEGHTYKISVNQIKNQNKDPNHCPHCNYNADSAQGHFSKGIPEKTIKDYCSQYDLDYEPKKDFYSRGNDTITLTCLKDGYKKEIKSLKNWESNKPVFNCTECENRKNGIISKKDLDKKLNSILNNKIITTQPIVELIDISLYPPMIQKYMDRWIPIEFENTRVKGKFKCRSCGYIKECYPANIEYGKNSCPECRRISENNRIYNKIVDLCKVSDCCPLTDYNTPSDKMAFKCNKCGKTFKKSWNDIKNDDLVKCKECFKSTKRKSQTEFYQWVCSVTDQNVIHESRDLGFELDVYIPSLKIAFEYCGLIWHSTKYRNDDKIHQNKYQKCLDLGIRLITIFEDEWNDKREICESRIKNMLNNGITRIFARKCAVNKIHNSIALKFCENNHIQGRGQANQSYGLFYNNELVSVMTFSKPSIAKNGRDYDWELNRFCSELNSVVVGGASKLLHAFKKDNTGKLTTFCDLRWGTGKVYENMGFEYSTTTRPNYYYFGKLTNWKRKHRFSFTKKSMMNILKLEMTNKTESELASELKLEKIFDCGNKRYEMTILKT